MDVVRRFVAFVIPSRTFRHGRQSPLTLSVRIAHRYVHVGLEAVASIGLLLAVLPRAASQEVRVPSWHLSSQPPAFPTATCPTCPTISRTPRRAAYNSVPQVVVPSVLSALSHGCWALALGAKAAVVPCAAAAALMGAASLACSGLFWWSAHRALAAMRRRGAPADARLDDDEEPEEAACRALLLVRVVARGGLSSTWCHNQISRGKREL